MMSLFRQMFTDHPESVDESYVEHMGQAGYFAGAMFLGAMACLVHALVPGLCKTSGSRIIGHLNDRMIVNRRRHARRETGVLHTN
ncbi:MAG: DUF6356 family protein [Minwuia sp.]|uniref:DUF6356 family protein n=1 Tax=Minwuia sp. TaxID=2493630 RepID=UPI003A877D94